MNRIKWAPILFAIAIIALVIPFSTMRLSPGEDVEEGFFGGSSGLFGSWVESTFKVALDEGDYEDVRLEMSVNGLDIVKLTQTGSKRDFVRSLKDLAEETEDVRKDFKADWADSDNLPDAEDINEFSDELLQVSKPWVIKTAAFAMNDDDALAAMELATVANEDSGLLEAVDGARGSVKLFAVLLGLVAVLSLAGIVLGILGKSGSGQQSMILGAAATVVMLVFIGIGSRATSIEIMNNELGVFKMLPGPGAILALVALVGATFMSYRERSVAAIPMIAHGGNFAPTPAPIPSMDFSAPTEMPTAGAGDFSTGGTVTEMPASSVPAWGATVIEERSPAPGMYASLRIVTGSGAGRSFDVKASGETRIGRDASMNDIVVGDNKVSGQHAKLRFENNVFTLFDLGSSNGTWVNDVPVSAPVTLKTEDRVKVGETVMVFQVASI